MSRQGENIKHTRGCPGRVLRTSDMLMLALALLALLAAAIHHHRGRIATLNSAKDFDSVMTELQEALLKRGYSIRKIQPVDKGLAKAGYALDTYKVVFYQNAEDMKKIKSRHPEFIAFLPLSFTLVKNKNGVRVISMPFNLLLKNAPSKRIRRLVKKWRRDSDAIVREIGRSPPPA